MPRLQLLLAAAIVLSAVRADATPEPSQGPCRVKLRSGRSVEASSLMPVDESRAFWRLEMKDGGSVVLPVRELRSATPAGMPELEPEPVGTTDADPTAHAKGCSSIESLSRWTDLAHANARKHGLDPALVQAVIAVESCGRADAVSPKGAIGLMQLLPTTAKDYGCADPKNPEANVEAGCRHLARLLNRMQGDVTLALAAYNAGEGAVAKAAGVPNFKETKRYVRDVLKRRQHLLAAATKPAGT